MRPQFNNRIARLSLRDLALPDGFSALKHRNYRLYFFGQAVSVTGTWMQSLAMSWLVLTLTSSAISLALVNVLQFAPTLVFGLFAGVLADRVPKRNLLVVTQSIAALSSATLAILIWTDRYRSLADLPDGPHRGHKQLVRYAGPAGLRLRNGRGPEGSPQRHRAQRNTFQYGTTRWSGTGGPGARPLRRGGLLCN